MSNDEVKDLVQRLSAVHYGLPVSNPSRERMDRQTVLDAIKEITLFQLREQQMAQDVKELSELRASSKTMKVLISDLSQKLSGKPATEPTISAGAIGRGVDEAEPKEG